MVITKDIFMRKYEYLEQEIHKITLKLCGGRAYTQREGSREGVVNYCAWVEIMRDKKMLDALTQKREDIQMQVRLQHV